MNYELLLAEKDNIIESRELQFKAILVVKDKKISDLQHQLDNLKKMIYGKKSERFIPNPYTGPNLFSHLDQDPTAIEALPQQTGETTKQVVTYQREVKSKHAGRKLLDNLPNTIKREEVLLPVEHSTEAIHIGDEVTEQLAYKPGKIYVIQQIRPKYKEPSTGKIVIAQLPAQAIDKCEAHSSLIAHVVVSKFVDHLPEYRTQQIFKRDGVVIPPSTMNGWVHKIGNYIAPIAIEIKKQILATGYLQMDESTIKVLKKDKTHTGYMWVVNSPQLSMSYFEYYKTRNKEVPKLILNDYEGSIQSDGYQAYEYIDGLISEITHYCCMAHARRKFIEATKNDKKNAEKILIKIQALYDKERYCRENENTHEQRKEKRKESIVILNELKEMLDKTALFIIPNSPIGQAIAYTLKRWDKLSKYAYTGHIEIDNNLVENAIRPLALGRKNYLFAGSHDAAANIAIYYTVFSSCKCLGVDPRKYLMWVLDNLPNHTIQQVNQFTPLAFKKLLLLNS